MSDLNEMNAVMVHGNDLPLHCPTKDTPAWNYHPRVFLDILATGQVKCPYCGTEYHVIPGTEPHGH
ncbi:MAG: zinc-finger domain-containing protein [Burkholderiaceae bacterium]|nr:zinc-finger domain-containing protein [Burkholderiaceae bacterium]NCU93435.1 zinc-finger domain-containing protein [Burkholderiaceae bacterium]NCX66588.1 zinc-finger domain-containing protein [Burkholderiaceae bacterium]NCZ77904.1 zinc-finger domain-containing protein [Burkholderiaceae bacterium]NDC20992.1 zinc-finger domain-containing protein [Burkholderiaceae bacterium]